MLCDIGISVRLCVVLYWAVGESVAIKVLMNYSVYVVLYLVMSVCVVLLYSVFSECVLCYY